MAKTSTKRKKAKPTQPKKEKGKAKGKAPEPRKNAALVTDMTKIRKQPEYLLFLQFSATPSVLWGEIWDVTSQAEFAKKIGVGEDTLSDWKRVPGYYDDVVQLNKQFFKARIGNVMLALETKSLDPNKVNGNDVRILATYAEAYSDRVETDHILPPEVQEALAKVAAVLG